MEDIFSINNLQSYDIPTLLSILLSSTPEQLEATDKFGNTPLLKVCYLGDAEKVRLLLTRNVNLHAMNKLGQNALTLAACSGNYETVLTLLRQKNYRDFTRSSIISPYEVAVWRGHPHLVEFFKSLGGRQIEPAHGLSEQDWNKIMEAFENGYNE